MLQASLLQAFVGKLQLTVLQPLLSYHVHCRGVEVKHNFGQLPAYRIQFSW